MKINAISTVKQGVSRQNDTKKTDVNFKGVEKAAQSAGQAAANAAGKAFSQGAGAANKAGAEKTGSANFLHTAFETVKFIGKKVLSGISKIINGISEFIKSGDKNAQKADSENLRTGAQKAVTAQDTAKPKEPASTVDTAAEEKIIPFPKKAEEGIEVDVAGKKYFYRPGKDKLPEGAIIQDGKLILNPESKFNIKEAIAKMKEAKELAEAWGKNE